MLLSGADGVRDVLVVAATYLTVGVSVLVHGLSAAPLVSRYAGWYRAAADTRTAAVESKPMHEHRARGPATLPSSSPSNAVGV